MRLLNERRRHAYPRLLLASMALSCVVAFSLLWTVSAKEGHHYGNDFSVFWAAGSVASRGNGPLVYDVATVHAQQRTVARDAPVIEWHYPPQNLVILLPFALVPFAVALAAWELLSGTIFLLAFHAVVNRRRWVGASLAAMPAFIIAVGFGQNGFFTAALLGGGLALLDSRPLLAGSLLGTISYKPHLAPLVVIALIAGRRWRALAGVVSSATLLALASLAIFGWSTWHAYLSDLPAATEFLDEPGRWQLMPTAYAAIRLLGGGPGPARLVQAGLSALVVGAVAWLWFRNARPELRNAALAVGMVLASPYAFIYDLPLTALAVTWAFRDAENNPWRRWEQAVVGSVIVLPVVAWPFAALTSIQLGPAVLAALLLVLLRRAAMEVTEQPAVRATAPTAAIDRADTAPI